MKNRTPKITRPAIDKRFSEIREEEGPLRRNVAIERLAHDLE